MQIAASFAGSEHAQVLRCWRWRSIRDLRIGSVRLVKRRFFDGKQRGVAIRDDGLQHT